MSAPTHTRPHPATTGGVDSRLPWWALALPALAFVVLLVMMLNPTDAQAAASDPMITHLFERAQQLIAR
jgi:anti-sigma-K factor RskA